jgi:hypothetical protein
MKFYPTSPASHNHSSAPSTVPLARRATVRPSRQCNWFESVASGFLFLMIAHHHFHIIQDSKLVGYPRNMPTPSFTLKVDAVVKEHV